jgi:hypothetical protein
LRQNLSGELEGRWKGGDSGGLPPFGLLILRVKYLPIEGYAVEAYCFKCKARREIKNPTRVWMKNGKPRMHGYCSVCKARMSVLVKR